MAVEFIHCHVYFLSGDGREVGSFEKYDEPIRWHFHLTRVLGDTGMSEIEIPR